MKKLNLKMIALGLIATLAITSCDVQGPRHGRSNHGGRGHDNHQGNRGNNGNRY